MKRHAQHLLGFTQRFGRNEQGSVLMLVGLSIVFLVAMAGSGIDFGLRGILRTQAQQSTDAASLAIASMGGPTASPTAGAQIDQGNRYFRLNFNGNQFGINKDAINPSISPSTAGNPVQVGISTATPITLPTSFVNLSGTNSIGTSASSSAQLAQLTQSDYDVVIVADESGSQGQGASCSAGLFGSGTRMNCMKNALKVMVDSMLPPGVVNPNVRVGVVGYTGYISNKWGPTSNNGAATNAVSQLRAIYQNFDHYGMLAGAMMVSGGLAGATNTQINLGFGTIQAPNEAIVGVAMPQPQTLRTNASDPNGMSPTKYVVFITDGGIMIEPRRNNDNAIVTLNGLPVAVGVNQHAAGVTCPAGANAGFCYDAFNTACNAVKNASGPNSVHLFVINYMTPAPALATTSMQQCASLNPITGLPEYMFASTPAQLAQILQNITTQIQGVQITQ
jgi:hypothetical protein